MPFFGSTLNVGAMVEPLTSQMADYLGVAERADGEAGGAQERGRRGRAQGIRRDSQGRRRIDRHLADWDRALRANQGKPVQVTILRDKKQQMLTLQVDSKHKGDVEFNGLLPDGPCPLMAMVDPGFAQDLAKGFALNESDIQSMREQAQALRDQMKEFEDEGGIANFAISPEQLEEFRTQAEQFKDAFKGQDFHLDQKQLDEMKQQMEEFQKNFNPESFKLDEKQMEQLKNQMQQFRQLHPPSFDEKFREQMQRQMDELKRQMEETQALGFGDHV